LHGLFPDLRLAAAAAKKNPAIRVGCGVCVSAFAAIRLPALTPAKVCKEERRNERARDFTDIDCVAANDLHTGGSCCKPMTLSTVQNQLLVLPKKVLSACSEIDYW